MSKILKNGKGEVCQLSKSEGNLNVRHFKIAPLKNRCKPNYIFRYSAR